jgi:hypothetical protein
MSKTWVTNRDGSDDIHGSRIRANTVELCDGCDEDTPHVASLTVKRESEGYGGAQPYRIAECLVCGHVSEERVGTGGMF